MESSNVGSLILPNNPVFSQGLAKGGLVFWIFLTVPIAFIFSTQIFMPRLPWYDGCERAAGQKELFGGIIFFGLTALIICIARLTCMESGRRVHLWFLINPMVDVYVATEGYRPSIVLEFK